MTAPLALLAAGYVLLMAYLALGLRLSRRRLPRTERAAGWPALARRVAGTASGGYLVLAGVAIGYGHWVAGGAFVSSALTGGALLIAVALPVFALASWLCAVRRGRR